MKRCLNCMEEFEDQIAICPYCGWNSTQIYGLDDDNDATIQEVELQPEDGLEQGTILKGRYIVGTMRKAGSDYRIYICFDALFSRKVLLLEYFPLRLSERCPNGMIKVRSGMEDDFLTGVARFLRHGQEQIQLDETGQMMEVFAMVEANGTCYAVIENPVKGQTVDQVVSFAERFTNPANASCGRNAGPAGTMSAAVQESREKPIAGFFRRLFGK